MSQEPIGKIISQIYRQNQKILGKELKSYQIGGGGQHHFLLEVIKNPGVNQDQLTAQLKYDKATTARAIKQLESAGYIKKECNPNDRRSNLLFPTEKASQVKPFLRKVLRTVNEELKSKLTTDEEMELIRLLKKLV